ncbi:Lipoprotein-releasing system ATP-binding protein LolD [Eikenella corrodens]|uniref:Lipoprotein-releasing system ATP-binding protein LolD n=2 Tax=Eikenella corrodens TaxID=539 RepID=C0DT20_EIKCO|nr:lipoprotein-releasing ABC transporter ATP-binding protein LolD [Eikenella corrodens]EEG24725.1 lipoprotein releasing system, ATP-binding protein [Eikenella corrodens ATCC 23834]OAM14713.1 lipoprotein releasing system, ATP-binding protein [Eikenella corrodens]UAK75598.1 lipoprotein-releasing ABC transporter ATP-binding protein LolD [Eikenella corrodens]SNW07029.1 Lipoprotein-releasing system ATP-binding protein LolD [Eikenella corrodens]
MNKEAVIQCQNVGKTYDDGSLKVEVLRNIDFQVASGEGIGIIGASGSGKSTLLHILGGLDKPTSGEVKIQGQGLNSLSQVAIGQLRNRHLGFVYQFHHLLPEFSALENVMMPLLVARKSRAEAQAAAAEILEKVGLGSRMTHRPSELSGGERQRAAIARALVTKPDCLLADEPTGNLDRKNATHALEMMLELKRELGTALIVVTHDEQLAKRFDRVLTMDDGCLRV